MLYLLLNRLENVVEAVLLFIGLGRLGDISVILLIRTQIDWYALSERVWFPNLLLFGEVVFEGLHERDLVRLSFGVLIQSRRKVLVGNQGVLRGVLLGLGLKRPQI